MRTFEINENITVSCEYYETRNNWGHKAWLFRDGLEIAKAKITYYNRTWEKYQYQSVLVKVLEKSNLFTNKEAYDIGASF